MLMHHDILVIEILGSLDDLIAQPARKYFHPIQLREELFTLCCQFAKGELLNTLLFKHNSCIEYFKYHLGGPQKGRGPLILNLQELMNGGTFLLLLLLL